MRLGRRPSRHHFAVNIAGNPAHVVVDGGQHRDRLFGDVHSGKDARGLGDARQALVDDLGPEMLQMQVDVIALGPDAATLADLDGHRAADDVARGKVFRVGRVALHEALARGIGEVTALASRAFGDQAARRRRCRWGGTARTPCPAAAGPRAAPCRRRRRCRYAPTCRKSRRDHSRRWPGSWYGRGSDAACPRPCRARRRRGTRRPP